MNKNKFEKDLYRCGEKSNDHLKKKGKGKQETKGEKILIHKNGIVFGQMSFLH